jgi:hypothetical protein
MLLACWKKQRRYKQKKKAKKLKIYIFITVLWSRDSSVGIATGYLLDNRGRRMSPGRIKNFLFSTSRLALGPTQPPVQWVWGAASRGGKSGRGVKLTTQRPTSAEVKNVWLYASTPPNTFMA